MRIHYNKYSIPLLTLLTAITACSSEEDMKIEGPKTPIALNVGVEGPQSRATVITDESEDKTFSAFAAGTGLWMAMQSDYEYLGTSTVPDEKDYKGSTEKKYCVTYGTTGTATGTVNPVNITGDYIRYWDDAHARSSALSIWALAVPGKASTEAPLASWNSAAGWGSSNPAKNIDWTIATAQDGTTIVDNDLCFSNNKVDYSSTGNTDRRMKFDKDASKFAEGKLVFYHALSKITVKMVEGDGFNTSSTTDFKLNNITLNGFKVSGTFDVANGAFSSTGSVTPITSMYQKEKTADGMTLEALVMPGTDLSTAGLTDAVKFSIDDNAFKVSSATLVEKLKAGDAGSDWNGIIEAGKNYVFTFRVSKTAVKVTATVKEWDVLNATQNEPKITVDTAYGQEADGTTLKTFTKNFSFLKSTILDSGYSDEADAEYGTSSYTLKPAQYWPDHNTHYFFRGVWPMIDSATDGSKTPTGSVTEDAIAVENVEYKENTYPSDLMLGYPRTTSETCSAHSKVVATDGICATEGDIRMNFQRVMTKVTVKLETTEEGSKDRVTFDENTTVEIVDGYTNGTILLSDGSATYTDSKVPSYVMHRNGTSNVEYIDAIIPQTLLGDTDNIKFRITVKSENDNFLDKYETLLGIKSIPVEGSTINKWEPGKHYVYTLTITKTGIKVTATIKDWIEAKGSTTITM